MCSVGIPLLLAFEASLTHGAGYHIDTYLHNKMPNDWPYFVEGSSFASFVDSPKHGAMVLEVRNGGCRFWRCPIIVLSVPQSSIPSHPSPVIHPPVIRPQIGIATIIITAVIVLSIVILSIVIPSIAVPAIIIPAIIIPPSVVPTIDLSPLGATVPPSFRL
ncbi:hypothetical protein BS47DRAFT_1361561 [Hydnum rufescens UP504]|uniref:Uncharacterized protein n=1 Tax=Hydnum rufescens UP504 TaxID=1448309 RepID=A0A9P6AZ63_9AGAM|nr:hypothetical protein BS47DRAFT_1361561 [Hydnum rufescens UP504]